MAGVAGLRRPLLRHRAELPGALAYSERRAGVDAPNFTGAGFELTAPPDAILDRMVIWRTGYRFASDGTAQGPWIVQGYRADASVIGGPLTGETCVIPAGQPSCRFGAEGAMAPGARVERDLETTKVLYSVGLLPPRRLRDRQRPGLPVRRAQHLGIDRHRAREHAAAGGRGAARSWRPAGAPTTRRSPLPPATGSGSAASACWSTAPQAEVVRPACDYRAMVPCAQQPARSLRFGSRLSDGRHTVSVEATDAAGNTNRVDRAVAVDRFGPVLTFVPSSGGRRIGVFADDPGAGVTGGTIEVRSRKAKQFRALRTRLRGGRLVARLARGSRRGLTIRASATDAVGHRSSITGAPVRLRAGFGRRLRASTRTRALAAPAGPRLAARLPRRPARRAPSRRAPARSASTARASGRSRS